MFFSENRKRKTESLGKSPFSFPFSDKKSSLIFIAQFSTFWCRRWKVFQTCFPRWKYSANSKENYLPGKFPQGKFTHGIYSDDQTPSFYVEILQRLRWALPSVVLAWTVEEVVLPPILEREVFVKASRKPAANLRQRMKKVLQDVNPLWFSKS